MSLALNIQELLGQARPSVSAPVEAGAVHCNGIVDLARLVPRASTASRAKAQRSILTAKSDQIGLR